MSAEGYLDLSFGTRKNLIEYIRICHYVGCN